jgi:hypothetical protein
LPILLQNMFPEKHQAKSVYFDGAPRM